MDKPTGNPFTDLTLGLADRIEQVVSEMEEMAATAPPYMAEKVSRDTVRRLLARMNLEQRAQVLAALPPELRAALIGGSTGHVPLSPVNSRQAP